ncbi:MAG TPA: TRAP transporter substrate-binding protein [Burkholderiales bacterium]|jgi:TRAP-type C4-dicarboxylate transport system substrate-binding protein
MKGYLKFLCLILVGVVGGATGPTLDAFAQSPIVLKVSHFLPPGHSISKGLVEWGEELKNRSNGRLQLDVYPAGKLGPPPKQYDLAVNGDVDISLALHGYTPGKFPLTEVAQLPFVVEEGAASSARLTELAPKYLAKEHLGVKILFLLSSPPLKIHLAHKRIDSVADFKGLRLRYSGAPVGEAVKALGGLPVEMAPGKVAEAMKKGELDGAIFPYEAVRPFHIHEVSKYSVEPGFNSVTFFLVMNEKKYSQLPKDLKKLIDDTTGPEAARRYGAQLDAQEDLGRKVMIASGVEIIHLSEAALSRIELATVRYTKRALGELESRGMPANTVFLQMVSANASIVRKKVTSSPPEEKGTKAKVATRQKTR